METKKNNLTNNLKLDHYLRLEPLINGVFQNSTMSEIMLAIENILKRPIMIIDMGFKIIDESPSINEKYKLYERDNTFLTENYIDQIKNNHIYANLTKREYLSTLISLSNHENILVSSIKINTIDVMMMIVFENNIHFETEDYLLVKKICSILSVQYQKEGIAYYSHMVLPNHTVFSLLNGENITKSELQKRINLFPWAKYEEHYIMILDDINEEAEFRTRHATILKSILAFIDENHCLTYKNQIIGFLGPKQFNNIYYKHKEDFINFLTSNYLICAISQSYTNLMESQQYYSLTQELLRCNRKYNLKMTYFIDSRLYVLHDFISNKYDSTYFYHPVIRKLKQYDSERNTNLLSTLITYLTYKSDPDVAAEHLYIHRSTLFYRIKKIREITGLDMDNFDEIVQVYFSMQINKIEDEFNSKSAKH